MSMLTGAALVLSVAAGASGQAIDPFYAPSYAFTDIGGVPMLPNNYGGLTTRLGDPNTLLIGGAANSGVGAIYAVPLIRDVDGHITGFAGPAVFFCEGAFNDGGVVYGPNGVLFTSRWPVNELGQVLPGSAVTNKVIVLAPFGVEGSNASINFVPPGYPGAGRVKIASWPGGQFGELTLSPDVDGTFNVDAFIDKPQARLPGGPEGFTYVPLGSALVPNPSMIVSEYSAGTVAIYELDSDGDPVLSTRRPFLTELFGAEGAFVDPVTGDFLFSTFGGGSRVVVVRGFTRPPAPCRLDFNDDGFIEPGDLDEFITSFFSDVEEERSRCDFNGDGFVEPGDLDDYITAYFAGC
ncbi:MAG: EF-hand domain-containing protein [Phycisphaerales bacterium]